MPNGFSRQVAAKGAEAADGERGAERCPRCESRDTKFCYYNNYNTAQPRHFCRSCRRYWTLGGSLRNVPIGGSSRKRQRPASPPSAVAKSQRALPGLVTPVHPMAFAHNGFGHLIPGPLPTGFLALGEPAFLEGRTGFDLGLGLGLGLGSGPEPSSSMDELSFGLSSALPWPPSLLDEEEALGAGDTWRMESGGGDCFSAAAAAASWPELGVASPAGGSGGPESGLH